MRWITKDRRFYKTILTLAIPISLQNLVTFLVSFADNVMVGALGDNAVSGIYLGGQIQFLLQQAVLGFGNGLMILSAQYWGKQDLRTIRRLIVLALRLACGVALALFLLAQIMPGQILGLLSKEEAALAEGVAYLRILSWSFLFYAVAQILVFAMRSVETARLGAYASGVALVLNVSLNWVLIFGKLGLPALGVRGAAVATLIARAVECGILVFYVFFKDPKLKMRLKRLVQPTGGLLRHYLRYTLPVLGGELVWGVNTLCQGAIIGHYTADVIAAASMTNTLNNLIYVWLNGLWGGVSVLVGKTIGEGKREKVKEYARTCQIIFLAIGAFSGSLIFLSKGAFIALYQGVSPAARAMARKLMTVLSVTIVGSCYEACCLGSLVKAGGDTSFVFKNDSIFVFLVVLPSALLASHFGMPVWFVYFCLKCDQVFKCFVAVVKVNRFRWIRELT